MNLRTRIAATVIDDSPCGDNLAIALCTYFSDHYQRPDDDDVVDGLWGPWVEARTNEALNRIVRAALEETK